MFWIDPVVISNPNVIQESNQNIYIVGTRIFLLVKESLESLHSRGRVIRTAQVSLDLFVTLSHISLHSRGWGIRSVHKLTHWESEFLDHKFQGGNIKFQVDQVSSKLGLQAESQDSGREHQVWSFSRISRFREGIVFHNLYKYPTWLTHSPPNPSRSTWM